MSRTNSSKSCHYLTGAGRKALQTDTGMADYLNWQIGRGRWVRDDFADLWVAPHPDFDGEGRAFIVFERGGEAYQFLVAPEALQ